MFLINKGLVKWFDTSICILWQHRCVAIRSSAYQWGAFIEADGVSGEVSGDMKLGRKFTLMFIYS
jgi:hypothetical protein